MDTNVNLVNASNAYISFNDEGFAYERQRPLKPSLEIFRDDMQGTIEGANEEVGQLLLLTESCGQPHIYD